jgi:hypothetical protein
MDPGPKKNLFHIKVVYGGFTAHRATRAIEDGARPVKAYRYAIIKHSEQWYRHAQNFVLYAANTSGLGRAIRSASIQPDGIAQGL